MLENPEKYSNNLLTDLSSVTIKKYDARNDVIVLRAMIETLIGILTPKQKEKFDQSFPGILSELRKSDAYRHPKK